MPERKGNESLVMIEDEFQSCRVNSILQCVGVAYLAHSEVAVGDEHVPIRDDGHGDGGEQRGCRSWPRGGQANHAIAHCSGDDATGNNLLTTKNRVRAKG